MTLRRLKLVDVATSAPYELGNPSGPIPVIEIDDQTGNIYIAQRQIVNTASPIQTSTVTLSAFQIQHWVATPIVIIPAPGAGKVIMPISAWGQFKHGTAYGGNFTNIEIDIYPQGGIDGWLFNNNSTAIETMLTGSSDGTIFFQSIQQTDSNTYNNAPLLLSASFFNSGELTTGTGTIVLTVNYSVLTLQ